LIFTLMSFWFKDTHVNSLEIPVNWFKAGSMPNQYDMGVDKSGISHHEKKAATIKSTSSSITGFGTLMQSCQADKFIGKRVRMVGYVKAEKVEDWSGLWLRIDGKGNADALAFDNMQNRSLKGTTDWAKCEIVLDVPLEASMFAFGGLLSGTGQIWFDDISFEIVDKTVPVSGETHSNVVREPSNLSFEK
jgi:hypothetical protein